jgi:hypothetical protein
VFSTEFDDDFFDSKKTMKKRFSDYIARGENKLLTNFKEKFGTSLLDEDEVDKSQ